MLKRAETPQAPRIVVAAVSDSTPGSFLALSAGPGSKSSIGVTTAYRNSLDSPPSGTPAQVLSAAAQDWGVAHAKTPDEVFAEHVQGWAEVWQAGVEVCS